MYVEIYTNYIRLLNLNSENRGSIKGIQKLSLKKKRIKF